MNGQTIINEVYRKLNGEFQNVDVDSDDWNNILSVLNENIDLYNKSANWRTSYNPNYTIGTVGTGEYYTINMDEISSIDGSNRSNILFYYDGSIVDKYKLVSQDVFDSSGDNDKVATINMNGLQIKPKTSDDIIYGCSIVLPVYMNVDAITSATDTVNTDDNYWLIVKTAADLSATAPVAFIARNFDDLNKQADERMKRMKKNNKIMQSPYPAVGLWNPSTRPDGR